MKNIKTITLSETEPSQVSCSPSGSAWTAGDQVTIFETDDSFGYCFHGIGKTGLYYEGDDITGFSTADEAEADARTYYESWQYPSTDR
jgi:hypothetical protein